MERGRGETRMREQKNRNQAFAKGIERGKGGRCHAEGASPRIFRGLQRVQNGALEGKGSFGFGAEAPTFSQPKGDFAAWPGVNRPPITISTACWASHR